MGPAAKDAIPTLTELAKDKDPGVRAGAAQAFGEVGAAAKEAIPALVGLLKDADRSPRAAAANALGNLQAKEAIPALCGAGEGPGRGRACRSRQCAWHDGIGSNASAYANDEG